MNLWQSLAGLIQLEVTSADPSVALQHIIGRNIEVHDVTYTADFTVEIKIHRKDFETVQEVISKKGDSLKVQRKIGLFWKVMKLWKRPAFLIGVMLLLLLAVGLSKRIYFVHVEGNSRLPTDMIVERAEECGIRFGTLRSVVRSEKMKNTLLSALPELEWAGVNTRGCVATIQVREKEQDATENMRNRSVSSIVASRDGIVASATVYRGNPICKPGQAVRAGETLVSGYTDCGLTIQANDADAEIMAYTYRTLCLYTPTYAAKRGEKLSVQRKYSLCIGKKLINFYKDSGICDTTCVKMYKENYMELPGGMQLPIALVTEEWQSYEIYEDEQDSCDWLEQAGLEYLKAQMISGQVLSHSSIIHVADRVCCMNGRYTCLEMIGQVKKEENIYSYGEQYREDR